MPRKPLSQRVIATSPAMKKAFLQLEQLKNSGDRKIEAYYNQKAKELAKILEKSYNPAIGVTPQIKKELRLWSKEVATQRNLFFADQITSSVEIANDYIAAEMQSAWGIVNPSARKDVAKDIMATVKKNLSAEASKAAKAQGISYGNLSSGWFENGFSRVNGKEQLIKQLSRNTVTFKDAVSSGRKLVVGGKFPITEGKLPKYLQELEDLARDAKKMGLTEFNKALKKAQKRVNKLRGQIQSGPKGQRIELITRGFKKKFLKAMKEAAKTGSEESIQAALTKYARDDAIYNATTLQRSATNDAFQTRVRTYAENNSELVDYAAWKLAPNRKVKQPGICDEYAAKRHDPKKIPDYPHYSCVCVIQLVMKSLAEFTRLRKR